MNDKGLTAALIILTILTIGCGIGFFVNWQTANEKITELNAANERAAAAEDRERALIRKLRVYQYVMGRGEAASKEEIEQFKADDETSDIMTQFKRDMSLYGAGLPETDRNYTRLAASLLATIQAKNIQLADRTAAELVANQRFADEEVARRKTLDDSIQKHLVTESDATIAARSETADQLQQFQAKQRESQATFQRTAQELASTRTSARQREDDLSQIIKQKEEQIDILVSKLEKEQQTTFEHEDGKIVYASQKQRIVWINLGEADKVNTQITFSVYDKEESVLTEGAQKGRVEVVEVLGPHMCQAKILEDDITNPILPGDKVHSPAWQPGRSIHFALAGLMDINDDRRSDRAYIRNLIFMNGGEVDSELTDEGEVKGRLTRDTRYLVIGQRPDEDSSGQLRQGWNEMLASATRLQTKQISLDELLSLMGWRPDVRTVKLGYGADSDGPRPASGAFRANQEAAGEGQQ